MPTKCPVISYPTAAHYSDFGLLGGGLWTLSWEVAVGTLSSLRNIVSQKSIKLENNDLV